MIPYFTPDNSYLYNSIEMMRQNMSPIRMQMLLWQRLLKNPLNSIKNTQLNQFLKANIEITERLTRIYKKPIFGIKTCVVEGVEQQIRKKVVQRDPFCHLIHFAKPNYTKYQPKLLVVAPMSGHHATLLRATVQDALPYFDIYITDWVDANQVPICNGSFDLDSFIDYIINYMRLLGPNLHVYAVCQPTVPVLAATAIMSDMNDPHVPKSLILTGGPIDARKNPTVPNDFAMERNLEWFDSTLITTVPSTYPGYRRKVYPGFLQLTGFLNMNLQRHIDSHVDMYKSLLVEDNEKADRQKKFYNEYLSVMDLPAEFYLQTIKEVFHDFSLAKGKFVSRGRKVNLSSITKSALFGIEGEKDDISAIGQTKAALDLCKNIPENKKEYYLQMGAGHYGVFSGSKFRDIIVHKMKDFVYAHD